MFSSIFGLPTHPLVVHAVVVLVPLAALGGLVTAVWPAARARYAPLVLVIATLALIAIPVATNSGEKLEPHVQPSPLLERHTQLADGLLPYMGLLWLGLVIMVALSRYAASRSDRWTSYAGIGAAVVIAAAAVGSGVQVARIGHSGSQAAWHGVITTRTGAAPHH